MASSGRISLYLAILFLLGLSGGGKGYAAESEDTLSSLRLNIDAKLFFQNDEFNTLLKGYTLPGFRLVPALEYRIGKRVSFQAGTSLMHYWGARLYPSQAYLGIPDYSETDNTKGVHIRPFLRLEFTTSSNWHFVAGDIYGGNFHQLIAPFYNEELDYASDPEAGLQIFYSGSILDFDLWCDWKTFIFQDSPYRENFFVGMSTRLRYNSPFSRWHFFSPIQAIIEHRGGEIDLIVDDSVDTFTNGAIGVGMRFNTGYNGLRWIEGEVDMLGSWQQAGSNWPYKNGWSVYAHATADIKGVKAHLGYYHADRFISILGLPLWGVASTKYPGMTLYSPSTITCGLEYEKEFAKGFTLAAKLSVYQLLDCDSYNPTIPGRYREKGTTNMSFGVVMTAEPSFLLKRFHK